MIRPHPFRRAQARHMGQAMKQDRPRLPWGWTACTYMHCPSRLTCLRMVGASNLDKDRVWADFLHDESGKCPAFIEVK